MLILWEFTKKQYIWGIAQKGGEGLVKNREDVFGGGVDTSMHTDLILVHDIT